MIPREFIQRLRETVPVSEIVGRRVPLKRKGREWEACCPFHQEKSPSFFVNDIKGFYHCFGCGAHGDALKFLMEFERMPYTEAVHSLAREVGLDVPQATPEQQRREQQRQTLEGVQEQAALWFAEQLQLAAGQEARDYLTRRGLSVETQKQFRLGYAPDSRTALRDHLLKRGASEQQLLDSGLIIQPENYPSHWERSANASEQGEGAVEAAPSPASHRSATSPSGRGGRSYDRFRGRVMFPILDAQGNVIAFGGRLLSKDEKAAKYLNSPETALFHKGQVLYNWRNARAATEEKKPLLVVEGYMDVIALHQYGFAESVAPLGTALTEDHLRKLWQVCDTPILCLDGDNAGQKAMWRALELALPLLTPGKSLQFCILPRGEDPDDFLRNHGTEAFRTLLKTAQPLSRVMVEYTRRQTGEETPEQKAKLEASLEALAKRIAHPSLQQHFRSYFRQQLWPKKKAPRAAAQQVTKLATVDGRKQGVRLLERQMLKLLLSHPPLLENASVEEGLGHLHLQDSQSGEIQQWLISGAGQFPQEGWPEAAVQLRDDKTVKLPASAAEEPLVVWQQLLDGYTLVHIQDDLDALKQEMLAEWSETRQQRVQELQRQIEHLQAKRFG